MRIKFSDHPVNNCDCGLDISEWEEGNIVISALICDEHRLIAYKLKSLIPSKPKQVRTINLESFFHQE